MKKLWIFPILLAGLLFGCQQATNATLDTSKLEKVEPRGNMTEDQLSGVPIVYEAPSLKEGLKALPFELKVPKKLPFDEMPLRITSIEDFKHDGKEIQIDLMSVSKNKDDKILFTISVHNFEVEYVGQTPGEEVQLEDGVVGSYDGGGILFEKDGVHYFIGYHNEHISADQRKKDLIAIAKEML